MKLTTTLNLLRKKGASPASMKMLIGHIGEDYGEDKPINLLTILESNCVNHFFWSMRATEQNFSDVRPTLLNIVCDIAESVLHIFESAYPGDGRPRGAIAAARKVAENDTEENRKAAAKSAYAADAAASGAYAYAYAAAKSAYAAYAAAACAAYAAYAAADAAYAAYAAYAAKSAYADTVSYSAANADTVSYVAEVEKQAMIIKKYLSLED